VIDLEERLGNDIFLSNGMRILDLEERLGNDIFLSNGMRILNSLSQKFPWTL